MKKEHIYTTYVDVWRGFLGHVSDDTINEFNNPEIISNSIKAMIEGELIHQQKVKDLNLEIYRYVKSNPFVGIVSTWEKDEQDDGAYELFASTPIFKGIDTKLTITEVDFYDDLYSGHITAESPICQTTNLTFRVPEFFKHMDIKPRTKQYVELAGLGMTVGKAPQIQSNKGWLYEKVLKKFLNVNPEKTQKDLPNIEVRQSFFRHEKCEDVYLFTTDVLSVEKSNLTFNETSVDMYKLKISPILNVDTGESIDMYLYVHDNTLKGYVPKLGDNIVGAMVLFGNII